MAATGIACIGHRMPDGIILKHDIMSPIVEVGQDTKQSLCTVPSQSLQCSMLGGKCTCDQHNIHLPHAAVMVFTQCIMKSHCISRRTL